MIIGGLSSTALWGVGDAGSGGFRVLLGVLAGAVVDVKVGVGARLGSGSTVGVRAAVGDEVGVSVVSGAEVNLGPTVDVSLAASSLIVGGAQAARSRVRPASISIQSNFLTIIILSGSLPLCSENGHKRAKACVAEFSTDGP
jgi:hypothetical protein